jgi:hypothetical protein
MIEIKARRKGSTALRRVSRERHRPLLHREVLELGFERAAGGEGGEGGVAGRGDDLPARLFGFLFGGLGVAVAEDGGDLPHQVFVDEAAGLAGAGVQDAVRAEVQLRPDELEQLVEQLDEIVAEVRSLADCRECGRFCLS